jgi:leucyl/phenylalanyl-tRNA--protein transferase
LLDCQFMTDHLASLGAIEVPRNAYLAALGVALSPAGARADWSALEALLSTSASPPADVTASGKVIAQLLGQTS